MKDWFRVDGLDETLLSFDEYQRLRMVSGLINSIRREGLTILDVGGGVGNLEYFVPGHRVVVADKGVNGIDGRDLPYKDKEFDISVSIDTLEHVPKGGREAFIGELIRVARRYVYLATPTDSAAEVEGFIHTLTKDPYLEEHIRQGLPDIEMVESYLKNKGLEYRTYKNGYLGSWFGMLLLRHFGPKEMLPFINRFYNQNFYEYDHSQPAYRIIFEIRIGS